ncbi:type II toxin-antitoxin system Phd/YefM family antitoxin [Pseudomonas nicosulfuronedens]
MRVIDIKDAKHHLLQLVDEAAQGKAFIIAKGGKPLVKVIPVTPPPARQQRLGFLAGQISLPENFDRYADDEIEQLFN